MSQPKSNEELIQPILSKFDVKFFDGSTYGASELFVKELLEILTEKDQELQKAREEERERILEYISSKVELCDTYYDFDVEMVSLETIRKALYLKITNLDT